MAAYTLENLPANGTLYVYVTGERYTPESIAFGDAAERGYVDWSYSSTTLHESRNDVRPLIAVDAVDLRNGRFYSSGLYLTESEVRSEVLDDIREVIGHADSSENGTIYSADETIWDYASPDTFMYTAHVFVKHYTASGYVESPVHIPIDELNN